MGGRGRNLRTERPCRHVLFPDYLLFARVIMERKFASKVHDDGAAPAFRFVL